MIFNIFYQNLPEMLQNHLCPSYYQCELVPSTPKRFSWAYGVVVSMFDFHRSDQGSNLTPAMPSKCYITPLYSSLKSLPFILADLQQKNYF